MLSRAMPRSSCCSHFCASVVSQRRPKISNNVAYLKAKRSDIDSALAAGNNDAGVAVLSNCGSPLARFVGGSATYKKHML